jgi:LemA protein
MELLLVVFGLPAVLALWAIHLYNTLIGLKNQVARVFGSINALLTQRHDLIPNLVATVQAYANHEASVLTQVTELRSQLGQPGLNDGDKLALANQMGQALQQLLASVEAYPELKANQNFLHLQETLTEIEAQLSAARRAYNGAVTDYNNALEMFPSSLMAGWMCLEAKPLYQAPEEHQPVPQVAALFQ